MGKIIARVREREKAAAAVRLREWQAEYERQRLQLMIARQAAATIDLGRYAGTYGGTIDEPEPDKWWTWKRMMALWPK